uniref:response regulator n=1 Tax=Enterocloster clostridioformis TaxID=1531 RepID=UPI0015D5A8DD|nr:response regulator [Enterocloster clostridioformis]
MFCVVVFISGGRILRLIHTTADRPLDKRITAEVLQQDGFRFIQKAYSGSEALRLCEEFTPDIVVLDIMTPDIIGIDLMFFIALLSVVTFSGIFLLSVVSVHTPDGATVRSNYPKELMKPTHPLPDYRRRFL